MSQPTIPIIASGQTYAASASSFNPRARALELIKKVNTLALTRGIDPEELDIDFAHRFTFEASVSGSFFLLSPLFLLKYEDIPADWRGITPDDLRLASPDFLIGVIKRLTSMFGRVEIDTEDILPFLLAFETPNKFEKIKEFNIAHELSHIKHLEMKNISSITETIETIGNVWRMIFSLIIPFLYPVVDQAFCFVRRMLPKFNSEESDRVRAYLNNDSKTIENYADWDAVDALGTAEGGLHFFDVLCKANQIILKLVPKAAERYDKKGNDLLDKDHPPLSERFAVLQAWQKKRNQLQIS